MEREWQFNNKSGLQKTQDTYFIIYKYILVVQTHTLVAKEEQVCLNDCTHSPVDLTWQGSRSWSKPLHVLLTLPSLCWIKHQTLSLNQHYFSWSDEADCNQVSVRQWEKMLVPTCFSQPWTAVCNHQRASDSSPWKASERCRWGRGWSCEHRQTHRSRSRVKSLQSQARRFPHMNLFVDACHNRDFKQQWLRGRLRCSRKKKKVWLVCRTQQYVTVVK